MRALLAATLVLAVPLPAEAATPRVVGTVALAYVPADQTIAQGDSLTLVNLESSPHDVTAVNYGDDGRLLFQSALVYTVGETAEVVGVAALEPGIYQYYCSVHEEMRGTVTVA